MFNIKKLIKCNNRSPAYYENKQKMEQDIKSGKSVRYTGRTKRDVSFINRIKYWFQYCYVYWKK